jgi:asparagine synthase (glutamine-hydrolysing)
MSGIAGIVNPYESNIQSQNISAMSDAIRIRGPNSTGLFFSANAAFLKRANCFDASSNERFVSTVTMAEKSYAIVLDGVIHNRNELCSEISSIVPNCFDITCQELLIHAYILWNEDFIKKLDGAFSFALWDEYEKTLILGRDRLGIKPLYYAYSDNTIIFASQIQGITSYPSYYPLMDLDGLCELILLSPRFTPGTTVIKGIHQVKPGYYIHYSRNGAKNKRYWKIQKQIHEDSLDTTLETVRNLIIESVIKQMKADKPVCGLLSGGLYSSIITTIAAENSGLLSGNTYNTWSLDYERSPKYLRCRDLADDTDTHWIRWVSRKAGTRHHYIVLSPRDIADSIIEAANTRGIPGMSDYDGSFMLLCREIGKDFGVLLSGDCSDEIFGSNVRFIEHFSSGRKRLPWASNIAEKMSIFNNDLISLLKPYEFIEKCYEEALAEFCRFVFNSERLNKEDEAQWFSLYWNLPCLLERIDRMSMVSGLEVRMPLCDVKLIEYYWNIPYNTKRLNNKDRGLLKEAMKGLLPDDILDRNKRPYPRLIDIEYENKIKNMVIDTILDPRSPIKNLLNLKTFESMLKQPQDLNKRYISKSGLYAWIIQLNHFMEVNGITII